MDIRTQIFSCLIGDETTFDPMIFKKEDLTEERIKYYSDLFEQDFEIIDIELTATKFVPKLSAWEEFDSFVLSNGINQCISKDPWTAFNEDGKFCKCDYSIFPPNDPFIHATWFIELLLKNKIYGYNT